MSSTDGLAPIRLILATLIKSESTRIDSALSPQEDSFRTNSFMSVPDLTPCARIRLGPSIQDCKTPLNPATKPQVAAIVTIHKPCPQSSSKSVSGSIIHQTRIEMPTKIPPIAEIRFDAL